MADIALAGFLDISYTAFMARPKRYTEAMVARFVEGTLARIDGVLQAGEDRADVVRLAIDAEVQRRARRAAREERARAAAVSAPAIERRRGAARQPRSR